MRFCNSRHNKLLEIYKTRTSLMYYSPTASVIMRPWHHYVGCYVTLVMMKLYISLSTIQLHFCGKWMHTQHNITYYYSPPLQYVWMYHLPSTSRHVVDYDRTELFSLPLHTSRWYVSCNALSVVRPRTCLVHPLVPHLASLVSRDMSYVS